LPAHIFDPYRNTHNLDILGRMAVPVGGWLTSAMACLVAILLRVCRFDAINQAPIKPVLKRHPS